MGGDTKTEIDVASRMEHLNRRFEDHLLEEQLYRKEYLLRQERQELNHEKNMEAIAALAEATKGVVEIWKVANSLQRFFRWLGGFSALAVILTYIFTHFPVKG